MSKSISDYLNCPLDKLDLEEALEFVRDMKIELAMYYARIEALQKLEAKIKEGIRESGEIPEVKGVIIKFGAPSQRYMTYTQKLVESAERENLGETIEKLGDLVTHIHDTEGQDLLFNIRQEFAKGYMPLSSFFYIKKISPAIRIET